MQTSKFGRNILLVAAIMIGLLTAACGGGAAAPTASGGTGGGGDAAAAGKSFMEAVFTGGDPAPFICSAEAANVDDIKKAYSSIAEAFTASGAKLDLSGLTYTVKDETADKATVVVGGKMVVDMSGTKQDIPMDDAKMEIPFVKDGDAWKICGG
jgi:hypothetical protein